MTVSLPADTHLALPGGTWEKRDDEWVRVENARWWREGGALYATYTHEEMEFAVGMRKHREEWENGVDRWWLEE